jgi:CBS domain-containing protein
MKTVKQILDGKGQEVLSVAPDDTVLDAVKLMASKGVGALLVVQDGALKGIITERDYARKVILEGHASATTLVRQIMTTKVLCAKPNETVEECMALMTDKRLRHLPVIDGEKLVGIISIGDLVKAIIAEQQFIISQLENYINS